MLDEDSNIKLIDFGLVAEPDVSTLLRLCFMCTNDIAWVSHSIFYTLQDTTELLETCCGSPAYAAPGNSLFSVHTNLFFIGGLTGAPLLLCR